MFLISIILQLLREFHIGTLDLLSLNSNSSFRNDHLTTALFRNSLIKYHTNDISACCLNCMILVNDGEMQDAASLLELQMESLFALKAAQIFVCCFNSGESPRIYPPININLFFIETKGENEAEIYEKYSINGKNISTSIATYRNRVWLKNFGRRSNLHRSHLRVLVENYPPYMVIGEYERNNQSLFLDLAERVPREALSGAFGTLLFGLADDLNFTFDLYRPWGDGRVGDWGRKGVNNSEWSGMMGMMQRKLFDLAAVPFSIKTSRAEVVDYVFPAGNYKLGLVIRDLHHEDFIWLTFGNSFRGETWIVVFIATFVVTLFIQFYYHQNSELKQMSDSSFVVLCENFCLAFAANFGGKFLADRVGNSGKERILVFIALFFGSIVFMAYRASLTSHLSLVKHRHPFHSLESLYENTDYTITTTRNSSKESSFRNAKPGSVKQKLWLERMEVKKEALLLRSVDDLVRKALETENVAIYHDLNTIGAATPLHRRCDLALAWAQDQLNHNSMVTPKHSPLTALLKHSTLDILQKGFIQRDISSQALPTGSHSCEEESSIRALTWQKVLPIALILASGGFFALMICMMETFSAKCCKIPRKDINNVGLKLINAAIESKKLELEDLVRYRSKLI